MNLEELREARLQDPFQPFSIRLTDGRVLPVDLPERLGIGPAFAILATENDAFVKLDPPMIESLVFKPNGKRATKRRRKS